MTPEQIRARGWAYWQTIYASESQNLLDDMRRSYPDLGSTMISYLLVDQSVLRSVSCIRSNHVVL
jgi:hypothetical protein